MRQSENGKAQQMIATSGKNCCQSFGVLHALFTIIIQIGDNHSDLGAWVPTRLSIKQLSNVRFQKQARVLSSTWITAIVVNERY